MSPRLLLRNCLIGCLYVVAAAAAAAVVGATMAMAERATIGDGTSTAREAERMMGAAAAASKAMREGVTSVLTAAVKAGRREMVVVLVDRLPWTC